MSVLFTIEHRFEHLARAERQYVTSADCDLIACLRIASDALILATHDEIAETGDFYFLTVLQNIFESVENRLYEL
jgi:hypothetical protein